VRVYRSEKKDGIQFEDNGRASVSVAALAKIGNIEDYCDDISVLSNTASNSSIQTIEELLGKEQPDLALVVAILVSTGWNLNDDIFTPEEVWKARKSPIHKPMNDNHQSENILGHIVATRVLDKSGNEVDGDTHPDEFDIEVAGVLYKAFPALAKRIEDIIEKAKAGELFVSMEAFFPDFSYGIIDPDTGETKIIERTEDTAFLTKHLRMYGGSGEYEGYRIGRVLKNLIFSAQGFVETPANPESVIKVAANKQVVSNVFVTAELSELSEGGVGDVDAKELEVLQAKLEEAQASLESKEKEVVELQKVIDGVSARNYDGQITALTEKVDELTANATETSEKVEAVEAEKAELQKQLDDATNRAEKSDAELTEIRKTEAARNRLEELKGVKEVEDEEAAIAELREMTDETFALVLKYAGEAKKEDEIVETEENLKESDTEDESTQAALDNVEETQDADLVVTEEKTETNQWVSTAQALLGREDKDNEGGE